MAYCVGGLSGPSSVGGGVSFNRLSSRGSRFKKFCRQRKELRKKTQKHFSGRDLTFLSFSCYYPHSLFLFFALLRPLCYQDIADLCSTTRLKNPSRPWSISGCGDVIENS